MTVWELGSRKKVFQAKLFDEKRPPGKLAPTTGRVAFNCDDSCLAAFGSEQSCFVISTAPLAFVKQGTAAGTGGPSTLRHLELGAPKMCAWGLRVAVGVMVLAFVMWVYEEYKSAQEISFRQNELWSFAIT